MKKKLRKKTKDQNLIFFEKKDQNRKQCVSEFLYGTHFLNSKILFFLKKGHAHQFYEACQVERSEKADGLPPRMFMACPKPKFLNAAEITAAKDPVCSLKNILMVVYKVHCEARTYTLSTQAADQFSDYFTEFRTNVELTYKKDSCIRLGYNKYK